jgi:hypothetical protein
MICYLLDQLHQEAGMVYDQLTETMIRLGLSIIIHIEWWLLGYKIEYGGKAGASTQLT